MMIGIDSRRRRHKRALPEIYTAACGFTLLELLVVMAILTVLGGLILPAVARTKGEARSIICRSHTRQLTLAWLMYASDYQGRLVPNTAGALDYRQCWLPGNPQLTMTERMVQEGPLFNYAPDVSIYRCPEDTGWVETEQRTFRRPVNYGLNIYLNGGLIRKSTGEWLGHPAVLRDTEISQPSLTHAFVDQDPEGCGGTQFVLYPRGSERWISFPADQHQGGASLSFVDGHVERWKWQSPKHGRWAMGMPLPVTDPMDRDDLQRLQGTIPNAIDRL